MTINNHDNSALNHEVKSASGERKGINGLTTKEDCRPVESNTSHLNASRVLHNSLVSIPPMVSAAEGCHLTFSTGERILDACTGAAVAIIGHGDADVQAAVAAQMSKLCYTHTVAFTTPVAEALADEILSGNQYGLSRAFFVCSGSEAMDSALKLARQYYVEIGQPNRKHIVARQRSYHGNTVGALSVSGHVARRKPFEDALVLNNVSFVSPTYAYRGQLEHESEDDYTARLIKELEEEFESRGPENIMAYVGETVGGATAGCLTAPKGYYQGVRRLCDKYGILLILDEVMCGSGRSGTYFAFEQEGPGVYPDLLTMGKGVGGGYAPMGVVLAHGKVIRGLQSGSSYFVHSHTYQAHAMSCAAALAVQKILRRDGLVARCAEKGAWLENALKTTFADSKYVGNIRGKGLFWGIEFVKDKASKQPFDPALRFTWRVVDEAFRRGMAIYPGAGTVDGVNGDHVLIAPAYNMSDADFENMVRLLKESYDAVSQGVEDVLVADSKGI